MIAASPRRRLRRRTGISSSRGVSDIIAELLVITITVVLAASLYGLVSGLTHTNESAPYLLGMGNPQVTERSTGYDSATIGINPEYGLTTAMAGLSLAGGAGTGIVPLGTAPAATCHPGARIDNATAPCTAPVSGVWYAALVNTSSETVASVWSLQTGGIGHWTGPTMELTQSQEILVVWGCSAGIAGSSDSLYAYALSTSSVSGQSGAF